MAIVNSLVNQIGREIGRDIYRSAKQSLLSTAKEHAISSRKYVDQNQQLLSEIQLFRFSTYKKVNERNLRKLADDVINDTDPQSFLFDDVYISFIDLLERFEENPEMVEEISNCLLKQFTIAREEHVEWLKALEHMKSEEFQKSLELIDAKKKDLQTLESRNPLIRWLLTPFGLGAAYYQIGYMKVHSLFGIVWASFSIYCLLNVSDPGSIFWLCISQAWLFLAQKWIHNPSETKKELLKMEVDLQSKELVLSSLKKQREILMNIKVD